MKFKTYANNTGDDNLRPVVIAEFHSPCCGKLIMLPVQQLIDSVANHIEEYYRKQNDYLLAENRKLREIIECGNQVALIRAMTAAGKI